MITCYWKFGVDILRGFQFIRNIREGAEHAHIGTWFKYHINYIL